MNDLKSILLSSDILKKKKKKRKDPFELSNSGVHERNAIDKVFHKEKQSNKRKKSKVQSSLEKKAAIYEEMQRGDGDLKHVEQNSLVNFDQKKKIEADSETAEIEDEYGRAKTVLVNSREFRESVAYVARELAIDKIQKESDLVYMDYTRIRPGQQQQQEQQFYPESRQQQQQQQAESGQQ